MTREEAINIVKGITDKIESTTDIDDWAEFWGFTREDYEDFLEMSIKALEQEPKTEWIPVSERLPKEYLCDDGYVEPSDYVLVWGDHGNYGISRYWGNRRSKSENPNTYKDWMDLDWVAQKPIAWMPLPEPYKAENKTEQGLSYTDQDTLMSAT